MPKSKSNIPRKYTITLTTIMPKMFSKTPVLAISYILILPLANIIVLGGVATGSINAMDADSVAVNIRSRGFNPMATETDARIGKIICDVAVLEVSSVKKLIDAAIITIIKKCGKDDKPDS